MPVVSLTVPALYVKSVNQDLLSGKACNKIVVRIILGEDPDISGLYPLDKEKQQQLLQPAKEIAAGMNLSQVFGVSGFLRA